ncbi:MAG: glycosyltransferase family 2 protein [Candidatus Hydrothermarchaeota archaeon]
MSDVNSLRKIAVIPVYDEVGKIGKVLARFTNPAVEEICLVVDRPSKTILHEIKTAIKKIGIPVHIIRNTQRKGVGYAIREGIEYALHEGYDIIVVMAGNNKDDPREIPRLLTPIVKDGYDYVQGSRFLPGGKHEKTPIFRGIFNRIFPFIWTLLTKVQCTDVTNGFRAYKTKIFKDKRFKIWQNWLDGYELEYYIHYKILTLGYKIREVPVSKTYSFRHKGGYSKISPLRDWWDIVSPLIYLKIGARK